MIEFAFVAHCCIRSINNFTLYFDRASYKADFQSPNVLM